MDFSFIVAAALTLGVMGSAMGTGEVVKAPLVISHRGFPCKYPEETLEGYEQAINMGVDFIEMDVISTKDDILILHHDILLDNTTNVTEIHKFQARRDTMEVDGQDLTGFFAVNMTYEEIDKYIRSRQRLPLRDHSFDGLFKIPKLEDVLTMLAKKRKEGKKVGAYIETKQPTFHDKLNKSLEAKLVDVLNRTGLLQEEGAIYLQSFEKQSLKKLHDLLDEPLPATWLIGCDAAIPTLEDLKAFKSYGTTIGPDKTLLVELNTTAECNYKPLLPEPNATAESNCSINATWCSASLGQHCLGRLSTPLASQTPPKSKLVDRAREAGLAVHAYTFRNEDMFMPLDFMSDPVLELNFYAGLPPFGLGIDGVFIDCPATAVPWKTGGSWNRTSSAGMDSGSPKNGPNALAPAVPVAMNNTLEGKGQIEEKAPAALVSRKNTSEGQGQIEEEALTAAVGKKNSSVIEQHIERNVEGLSTGCDAQVLNIDNRTVHQHSSGVVAVIIILSLTVAVLAILYTRARRRLARGDFRKILDVEMNQ